VASPALEANLDAFPVGDRWLRTSPEFALKRALAAGMPRIYELGPAFRAEESGPWHRSEFLMLEWYRAGATLPDLMVEVQALVRAVASALGVPEPAPFRRTTVRALMSATGVDPATATAEQLSARDADDWDAAFFRRWIEQVEPGLTDPCFVEGWPASQAALATLRQDGDWTVADRFEAYLGGVEIGNAFQECGDEALLRRRWARNNQERAARLRPPHPVDEDFLRAVRHLPRSAGIAVGVDRLLAVLAGQGAIAGFALG
jgi:lysyl-tRNA synthetase class 2